MHSKKAIIIGSGIAGMAVSIRLAVQGFDVHVYESNSYPGGKLSFFEKEGYKFDEGPSLFTQPNNIEALFSLANEPIKDYFEYVSVPIACTYFFENGKKVNAYTEKNKFAKELALVLNEKTTSTIDYLESAENLYNNVGAVFLNHSLHNKKTWLHTRVFKALRSIRFNYLFRSLNHHNKSKFSSAEAIQIFNRFATYNGSNPYKAPGMLSLIPHLEQNEGTFYPKGGMINITNALHQLALKKGVQFHFNHPIDKITSDKNKVTGVVVNGELVNSSIVVSNSDIYYTFKNLLSDSKKATKIEKIERSSSALIFYWGINTNFSVLGLHNILFSENYEEEFNALFNNKKCVSDPTVYINITAKMESDHAPAGSENWFVMINAPENNGQDWNEFVKETRKFVIEKINRILKTNIEEYIQTETIMDPVMIERKTNTYKGSLYGTSSNSILAAFFRPANFTNKLKGLYFCGGTVHPGGGIPLCLKSAYITAELIKNDYGK